MSPSPRSSTLSNLSQLSQSADSKCGNCNKSTRKKGSIKCSSCNITFDANCANLSLALLDEVTKHRKSAAKNKSSFSWRCPNCTGSQTSENNTDILGLDARLDDLFDSLKSRLEALISSSIQTLLRENEIKFAETVSSKILELKTELELRIAALEANQVNMKSHFESRIAVTATNPAPDKAERAKNLLCFGIPNGDATALPDVVSRICSKYDPDFDIASVSFSRLTARDELAPPVIVKFATKRARNNVFLNYIKTCDLKLTDVMNGACQDTRIYLNEHLSKEEAALVRQCRVLKQEKKIHRFTLRDGDIYIHFTPDKKVRSGPITDTQQLNALVADK